MELKNIVKAIIFTTIIFIVGIIITIMIKLFPQTAVSIAILLLIFIIGGNIYARYQDKNLDKAINRWIKEDKKGDKNK